MPEINPADVKKLRELTGVGMMDAKGALVEAGGDMQKAQDILRKAGAASAAKRADREARAGLVEAYTHAGKIGVVVEVNCETDFVARTDDFKSFTHDIAMQIAASDPQYVAPTDVPEDVIEKEKEIYADSLAGKPEMENVRDKIIAGKLDKYFQTVCLSKQPYVKDPAKNIEELTTELIAKVGENIVIRRFSRIELGVAEVE